MEALCNLIKHIPALAVCVLQQLTAEEPHWRDTGLYQGPSVAQSRKQQGAVRKLVILTETPWKFRKPSGTCLFKHITALTKENMTALIKIIKNLVQITKFLNPASVSSRTVAAPSLPYLQMSNQLLTQVLVQVDDRNNVENHSAFHVAELVQGHCGHLKVHWPVGFTRK